MRGSGWLPRTSALLRCLVAVAAVVLAWRDLPWWRWVSALPCSLGLYTQADSRMECPLPRALSAPSDFSLCSSPNYRHFQLFYEKPYLFNELFFFTKFEWDPNANWTIHKFCCFKVSILNIWFWTQSVQSSTSFVWLCLVRCFSLSHFLPVPPSSVHPGSAVLRGT